MLSNSKPRLDTNKALGDSRLGDDLWGVNQSLGVKQTDAVEISNRESNQTNRTHKSWLAVALDWAPPERHIYVYIYM